MWCSDELVAVVTTTAGGVEALCRDGSTIPVETDGLVRKATIGGTDLVLHRQPSADEGPVEMLAIDLATGAQRVLGEGYLPALSPAGRLAWMSLESGQPVCASPSAHVTSPRWKWDYPTDRQSTGCHGTGAVAG